jgi:hypothetical protein
MGLTIVGQKFGPFTLEAIADSEADTQVVKPVLEYMISYIAWELSNSALAVPESPDTDIELVAMTYSTLKDEHIRGMVAASTIAQEVLKKYSSIEYELNNEIPHTSATVVVKLRFNLDPETIAVGLSFSSTLRDFVRSKKTFFKGLLEIFKLALTNRERALNETIKQIRSIGFRPELRGLYLEHLTENVRMLANIVFAKHVVKEVLEWM